MHAVGLTPVDDVFLLHAVATQKAIARQPRQPATAPSCEISSPPSVGIADLNLGVRTGETYAALPSRPHTLHVPMYETYTPSPRDPTPLYQGE